MKKIKITIPFIVAAAVLVFFDSRWRLIFIMSAMLIHECGHFFGLIYKDIEFKHIKIGISGANIEYGAKRLTSYKDDIFIALLGGAFNFAAIMAAIVIYKVFKIDLSFFIGINALLGVFNMLPVFPLDGGRVLYSVLAMRLPLNTAEFIVRTLSLVSGGIGAFFGAYIMALGKGNFTLFFISLYIILRNINITQAQ